jgi:hypothetical protein
MTTSRQPQGSKENHKIRQGNHTTLPRTSFRGRLNVNSKTGLSGGASLLFCSMEIMYVQFIDFHRQNKTRQPQDKQTQDKTAKTILVSA